MDYPSADMLLRTRYGIKPKERGVAKPGESVDRDIGSFMGPAQPMPEKLRALIEWADNPDSWKKK